MQNLKWWILKLSIAKLKKISGSNTGEFKELFRFIIILIHYKLLKKVLIRNFKINIYAI